MILRWGKPPGSEHNTNLAWSNLAPTNSFFSLSLSLSLTLLLLFFWFFIFYFAAEVIDMQKEIYSMAGWSIVFFNISVNQYFVLFYYLLVFNALLKYCQSSFPAAIESSAYCVIYVRSNRTAKVKFSLFTYKLQQTCNNNNNYSSKINNNNNKQQPQ